MKRFVLIIIILLASGYITKAYLDRNQNAEWQKIGVTTISLKENKSEILVLESANYKALKFRSTGAAVNLLAAEIFYETGNSQNTRMNVTISPHRDSPVIELMEGERKLMKVNFEYRSPEPDSSRTVIELWGSVSQKQ